ncbi:DUF481 domain-containing protein [Marinobacter sp. CHS3-4]|uniref:DUF481 domain-containing protein n=1 Tax=Marinobacter sp. CHS3-4 TaxID=3045174 RepID=UPI0024B49E96|nr:DUF481 domain-containing protein [Marinobacter sp. CHS3-4]MDI9244564.1 DUF481 domain-containing protein [Marinobacter sp. CHS3-4]
MDLRKVMGVCLGLLMPLTVQSQEETDTWQGEAEVGALITSGNTEETNIKSRFAVKHEVAKWRNNAEIRTNYSETADNTTAEKYRLVSESDYKFSERQFWFVRGFYEDDRFSGYEFRSSLTTGYGNRVWSEGKRSFLDITLGAGYRLDKLEVPNSEGTKDEDDLIGRLAAQYDQAMSETALFRQQVSAERGFDTDSTLIESETSLQANIVGSLSMKAAYRVQYFSEPPAEAEKTDTELSVSLLYGF